MLESSELSSELFFDPRMHDFYSTFFIISNQPNTSDNFFKTKISMNQDWPLGSLTIFHCILFMIKEKQQ